MKTEFKEKLLKYQAYEKYVANFKKQHPDWELSEMDNEVCFSEFLRGSFYFSETPEGFDYWWKLSEK